MEVKQTQQMVTWLDEERRKDKTLIGKLEERTASQAAIIEDQARRLQKMEGDIAAVRNSIISPTLIDDAVTRVRMEISALSDQFLARRDQNDVEMRKLRDMDRETFLKGIEELRGEFNVRLERELAIRRAEEERLSRVAVELQSYASNLSKGLEEFERSLSFLEEQRRTDSRRISELSGEVTDLTKRVEGYKPKVELIEELARRNERSVTALSTDLSDFKAQRQAWIEQEALAAQQREQVMNDMLRRIDGFATDMENFAKQVSGWADTQRVMKKQIEDFDRLADRVDRRLNEVAEVQRLSEERFRAEWEEWGQDDQKRWRQFTLTNEEARREAVRAQEDVQAQTARVSEMVAIFTDHIKRLRSSQTEMVRQMSTMTQTMREQVDEALTTNLPPLP